MKPLATAISRQDITNERKLSDYFQDNATFLPIGRRHPSLSDQRWHISPSRAVLAVSLAIGYRTISAAPFDPGRKTGLVFNLPYGDIEVTVPDPTGNCRLYFMPY